jgi:hypothetical protein
MKIRRALLAGFIALISSLCFAQEATRDTTGDAPFKDAVLKEHPHYHTFTHFREPDHGWQVFLWHVGG